MDKQYIGGFLERDTNIDIALQIHLQGNHYPLVSPDFIPICKAAIVACNVEDYDKVLLMPNGINKTAAEVVDGLHLDSFLEVLE